MPRVPLLLATATILFQLHTAPLDATEILSVTNVAAVPLTTPQQDGYYDLIAIEAFKRIGREITIQTVPGERALINLNNGDDDATFVRVHGLETTFLDLRVVPEKIIDFEFVAFTLDPNIEVKEWTDLKSYSVAYIIG